MRVPGRGHSGRALRQVDGESILELLSDLLAGYRPRDFAVELWDGARWEAEVEPRFTVIARRPAALRAFLDLKSDLGLGEAYVFGDVDVVGDLEAVFQVGRSLAQQVDLSSVAKMRAILSVMRAAPPLAAAGVTARMRGRRSSAARDRRAIQFHYDRSNEFFAQFLDRRMVYSCAYFASADDSLEAAQQRKLDLVCRKLRLRPGDRLLDIGCGWGALVIHAAHHHGVQALGLTLSEQQAALAQQRIDAAGLGTRCRVEVRDYRSLDRMRFDRIASVGMVEHVPRRALGDYYRRAWDLLRPGGTMLNHGIAVTEPAGPRSQFIRRYVFPDAALAPLAETLAAAAGAGFEVRDVEALRDHYTLTLRRWVSRLEAHQAEAIAAAGEETYRVWRLYMAGAANAFDANRLGVFQTLLVKPDDGRSDLPLTRADWYAG